MTSRATILLFAPLALLAAFVGGRHLAQLTFGPTAVAQDEPADSSSLEFIRVHAPKSKLHELASAHPPGYYMPMKREAFESALTKIRNKQSTDSAARIDQSIYVARLLRSDGHAFLEGSGEWTVQLSEDWDSEADAMLPMGNCGIAINGPLWKTEPPTRAEVGLDDQERLTLAVPQSGVASFNWSLRGKTGEQGVGFRLQFPNAATRKLYLALPQNLTPELANGVASDVTDQFESKLPKIVAETLQPEPSQTIWQFELPGVDNVQLRLREGPPQRVARANFRKQSVYRLDLGGAELQMDLQFDGELPSELLLAISPELRLDARVGNTVLPMENAGPQQLLLRLPPDRSETSVRLQGVAELPLDKLWTLPQIYVENESWREGEQRILISDRLRLQRMVATACRQFDRRRQNDGREEVRFREEADAATVQVQLGQRDRQLESRSGIAIRWDEAQLTATSTSVFSTAWGDIFSLDLQAPQGWQLDSVETEPADALDVEQLQLQPQQGKLTVPLARAVSPQQSVRVKLFAHRAAPANNGPVSGRSLLIGRPLTSNNIGYLAFQGEQVNDATLVRVASTSADVADLIEPLAGATVISDESGLAELSIRKPPLRPEYRVEINMTAVPDTVGLQQHYEMRCIPESSAIDRIRIQASEPMPPLHWTVEGEESVTLIPLDDGQSEPPVGPMGDNAAPDGEDTTAAATADTPRGQGRRWDILLARPLDEPFVLKASHQQTWPSATPDSDMANGLVLGLLSVPEAISQRGAVRVENTTPVIIEAPALERLPLDNGGSQTLASLQAAFRYEPATPMRLQMLPLNAASVQQGVLNPASAQVLSLHQHSRFEGDGSGSHRANILVANQGVAELQIVLPPEARPLRLLVNQQMQPLAVRSQQVRVRLPPGRRHVAIQLAFRSKGEGLGWRGELQAPLLKVSVPVAEQRWTFDLPPGFDLAPQEIPSGGRRTLAQWREQLTLPFASVAPQSGTASHWNRRLLELHNSPDIATWGQLLEAAGQRPQGSPLWIHAESLAGLQINPTTVLKPNAEDLAEYGLGVYQFDDRVCLVDICRQPRGFGSHSVTNVVGCATWVKRAASHRWLLELPEDDQINRGRLRRGRAIGVADLARGAAVIQVRRLAVVRALMIGLLLITTGVVYRSTQATTLCWWAIGWMAAWLMPAPWSWCGAAVGWGACLGLLIQQVASPRWPVWVSAPRVWGRVLAAFAIFLCASLVAQAPQDPLAPLHRVLIPVNADGDPDGDNVSVPLPIWKVLDAAERDVQLSSVAWLLTDADYELSLDNPGEDNPLTMTTSYRIRVLRQGAEVRLRMNRADGPVVTAVLDGIETNIRWTEAGDHLVVATNLPGVYDLSVTRIIASNGNMGIDVEAPPLPTASLSFESVDFLRQAELTSAKGSEARAAGRVSAELGGADQLSITWNALAASKGAKQVEEHLWLQVRRVNSVVVRSLFRFQSEQDLGALQLFADDRLRLIKLELDGKEVTPTQTQASHGTLLTVDATGKRTAEISADFHFKGVSGVGRIQPPKLYTHSPATARRWFAVSTEEQDLQAEFSGNAAPLDSDQFSVSWPAAEGILQTARIDDENFELLMRYGTPAPTVHQLTRIKMSRQRSTVQFEATLANLGSATFQHLFAIPQGLQIHSVRVLEEGVEAPHHFEVDEAGNLSIFLDRPAAAEQWLELRGVYRGSVRRLPRLRAVSASVLSDEIKLYRNFDVSQVEILQATDVAIDRERAGEFERNSRIVATLTPESPRYNCRLRPVINRRRATADSTTLLKRKAGQWFAEFRGRVAVSDGVVDALRVRMPAQLQPQIVSPSTVRLLPGVTETREWRIIPDQPIVDAIEFVIEAPLAPGEDGVLRAPDILMQGLSGRRFVALPRTAEGQPVRWTTPRGLQAVEPSIGAVDGQTLDLFEVVDRRFEASLRRTERVAGSPLVLLADIHIRDNGDETQGVATFDLEPGGRRTVAIDTHQHCEVLSVRVNGVRAPALERGDGIWVVSLGPHDLPQRVEVDYRGAMESGALYAPTIAGVDTARTMWTVFGPRAADVAMPYVTDTQQTLWRVETIATLLNSAAEVAINRPLEDIRVWHRPWALRWFEQQEQLAQLELTEGERERANSFAEMQALVAEQLRVADQLPALQSSVQSPSSRAIRLTTQQRESPRHVSIQGASHELALTTDAANQRTTAVLTWLAAAMLLMGLALWIGNSTAPHRAATASNAPLLLVGLALLLAHPIPWLGVGVLVVAMLRAVGNRRSPSARMARG